MATARLLICHLPSASGQPDAAAVAWEEEEDGFPNASLKGGKRERGPLVRRMGSHPSIRPQGRWSPLKPGLALPGPQGAPFPSRWPPVVGDRARARGALTLALGVGPARALAQLALGVLAHGARQARVHVVGLVGVGAVGALLAHGVLLVLAGVHEARARLAHAARLAAARGLVLVVAVGAAAHGVVRLHAGRRHALQPHALGARLAGLRGAHHVGERHACGRRDVGSSRGPRFQSPACWAAGPQGLQALPPSLPRPPLPGPLPGR